MSKRVWIRTIIFWALMVLLALAVRRLFDLEQGSAWRRVAGFGPLAGVVLLFVVVICLDRVMKDKRQRQGAK
jgi:hypothetical protein